MCDNGSRDYPGRWGELAGLLLLVHEHLEEAGIAGAEPSRLAALSRAARTVVRDAAADVEVAVERAGLIAVEARDLAVRTSWTGPFEGCRSVATQWEPSR